MKLVLIASREDHKLCPAAYSQTYYSMFKSLLKRFGKETYVVFGDCSAKDIEADVIIFFDPHSSHHIKIDGIADHPALKYTYINDPHQKGMTGQYRDGTSVKKLGARERIKRAFERGVKFVICPYTDGYYEFLAEHMEECYGIRGGEVDNWLWFPVAPAKPELEITQLSQRCKKILANGCTWSGKGFECYAFRRWAYNRPEVHYIDHCLQKDATPSRDRYMPWLSSFVGSLALTEWYVVPKYLEIPLAGCVCLAQYHEDYQRMGFEDGVNCYFVTRNTFAARVALVLNNIQEHQLMADRGRELVESKYTAKHFAEFIYNHASAHLTGDK